MSYDCCFRDYNPFKIPICTHTKEYELEIAYDALKREFNFLRSTYG